MSQIQFRYVDELPNLEIMRDSACHVPNILRHQLLSSILNRYIRKEHTSFLEHKPSTFTEVTTTNVSTAQDNTTVTPRVSNFESESSIRRFFGALLFVDISGFTVLSRTLEIGPLQNHINSYFSKIIDVVDKWGGDVVKFAGDALYIIWRLDLSNMEDNLECTANNILKHPKFRELASTICYQAVECGKEINRNCCNYKVELTAPKKNNWSTIKTKVFSPNAEITPNLTEAYLDVHSGVAFGLMAGVDIGLKDRWEFFLLGNPIDEVAMAEGMANKGELIITSIVHSMVHNIEHDKNLIGKIDCGCTLLIDDESKKNFYCVDCENSEAKKIMELDENDTKKESYLNPSINFNIANHKNSSQTFSINNYKIAYEKDLKSVLNSLSYYLQDNILLISDFIGIKFDNNNIENDENKYIVLSLSKDIFIKKILEHIKIKLFFDKTIKNYSLTYIHNFLLQDLRRHVHEAVRNSNEALSNQFQFELLTTLANLIKEIAIEISEGKESTYIDDDEFKNKNESISEIDSLISESKKNIKKVASKEENSSIALSDYRTVYVLFIKIDGISSSICHHPISNTSDDTNTISFNSKVLKSFNFLQPTSLEESADEEVLEELQECIEVILSETTKSNGQLRQFIIDDKGTVAICTFGMKGATVGDNAAAALATAQKIIRGLQSLELSASIGITCGRAYCGFVGSHHRHEYACMGPSTNLSARLMGKAEVNTAICDSEIKKQDRNHNFTSCGEIQAKGYDQPVAIFKANLSDNKAVAMNNSIGSKSSRFTIDSMIHFEDFIKNTNNSRKKKVSPSSIVDLIMSSSFYLSQNNSEKKSNSNLYGRNEEILKILNFLLIPFDDYSTYDIKAASIKSSMKKSVANLASLSEKLNSELDKPPSKYFTVKGYSRLLLVSGREGYGKSAILDSIETKLRKIKNKKGYESLFNIFTLRNNSTTLNSLFAFGSWKQILVNLLTRYEYFFSSFGVSSSVPVSRSGSLALDPDDKSLLKSSDINLPTDTLSSVSSENIKLAENIGTSDTPRNISKISSALLNILPNLSLNSQRYLYLLYELKILSGSCPIQFNQDEDKDLSLDKKYEETLNILFEIFNLYPKLTNELLFITLEKINLFDDWSFKFLINLWENSSGILILCASGLRHQTYKNLKNQAKKINKKKKRLTEFELNGEAIDSNKTVSDDDDDEDEVEEEEIGELISQPNNLDNLLYNFNKAQSNSFYFSEIVLNNLPYSSSVSVLTEICPVLKESSESLHLIHDLTAGIPMYLAEMASNLSDFTQAQEEKKVTITSPLLVNHINLTIYSIKRIEEAICYRFDKLEPIEQNILRAASVIASYQPHHFNFTYLNLILPILLRITRESITKDDILKGLTNLLKSGEFISFAPSVQPNLEDNKLVKSPLKQALSSSDFSLINLEEQELIFTVKLERQVIYNMLGDKEKCAFHSEIGQYIYDQVLKNASNGIVERTNESLVEEGFHWNAAKQYRKALFCYSAAIEASALAGNIINFKNNIDLSLKLFASMKKEKGITKTPSLNLDKLKLALNFNLSSALGLSSTPHPQSHDKNENDFVEVGTISAQNSSSNITSANASEDNLNPLSLENLFDLCDQRVDILTSLINLHIYALYYDLITIDKPSFFAVALDDSLLMLLLTCNLNDLDEKFKDQKIPSSISSSVITGPSLGDISKSTTGLGLGSNLGNLRTNGSIPPSPISNSTRASMSSRRRDTVILNTNSSNKVNMKNFFLDNFLRYYRLIFFAYIQKQTYFPSSDEERLLKALVVCEKFFEIEKKYGGSDGVISDYQTDILKEFTSSTTFISTTNGGDSNTPSVSNFISSLNSLDFTNLPIHALIPLTQKIIILIMLGKIDEIKDITLNIFLYYHSNVKKFNQIFENYYGIDIIPSGLSFLLQQIVLFGEFYWFNKLSDMLVSSLKNMKSSYSKMYCYLPLCTSYILTYNFKQALLCLDIANFNGIWDLKDKKLECEIDEEDESHNSNLTSPPLLNIHVNFLPSFLFNDLKKILEQSSIKLGNGTGSELIMQYHDLDINMETNLKENSLQLVSFVANYLFCSGLGVPSIELISTIYNEFLLNSSISSLIGDNLRENWVGIYLAQRGNFTNISALFPLSLFNLILRNTFVFEKKQKSKNSILDIIKMFNKSNATFENLLKFSTSFSNLNQHFGSFIIGEVLTLVKLTPDNQAKGKEIFNDSIKILIQNIQKSNKINNSNDLELFHLNYLHNCDLTDKSLQETEQENQD